MPATFTSMSSVGSAIVDRFDSFVLSRDRGGLKVYGLVDIHLRVSEDLYLTGEVCFRAVNVLWRGSLLPRPLHTDFAAAGIPHRSTC